MHDGKIRNIFLKNGSTFLTYVSPPILRAKIQVMIFFWSSGNNIVYAMNWCLASCFCQSEYAKCPPLCPLICSRGPSETRTNILIFPMNKLSLGALRRAVTYWGLAECWSLCQSRALGSRGPGEPSSSGGSEGLRGRCLRTHVQSCASGPLILLPSASVTCVKPHLESVRFIPRSKTPRRTLRRFLWAARATHWLATFCEKIFKCQHKSFP